MRDNDRDGTDAFHYVTANGKAMNVRVGALVLPEGLMREAMRARVAVL